MELSDRQKLDIALDMLYSDDLERFAQRCNEAIKEKEQEKWMTVSFIVQEIQTKDGLATKKTLRCQITGTLTPKRKAEIMDALSELGGE